jgi:hypothetical protein
MRDQSNHIGGIFCIPCVQFPLWQSVASLQDCPARHEAHIPPQSISVSFWFLMPSEHVGAAHRPARKQSWYGCYVCDGIVVNMYVGTLKM